jgi:hypothetical protein
LKTNERYGRWVGAIWRESQLNMKAGWTHSWQVKQFNQKLTTPCHSRPQSPQKFLLPSSYYQLQPITYTIPSPSWEETFCLFFIFLVKQIYKIDSKKVQNFFLKTRENSVPEKLLYFVSIFFSIF